MLNKRGLSAIISVMLLILLVLSLVAVIWVMVKNIVEKNIEDTENCFGIFEEVRINNDFTCYDSGSGEVHFSLEIGEIDVDSVIVSISTETDSQIFELFNTNVSIPNLKLFEGSTNVNLPSKRGSKTYIASNFINDPILIQIAPVVKNTVCEVSDSLSEITDCKLLV